MMNRFACLTLLCLIAAAPATAQSQDLAEKIKAPMATYSFTGTLSSALVDLAKKGSVEINVDWSLLEAAGVTRDTKVGVQAKDVTWEQALDIVLDKASPKDQPLAWYKNGGAIRVSTQQAVVNGASRMRVPAGAPSTQPAGEPRTASPTRTRTGKDIDFSNAPLGNVLKFFQEAGKLNLAVNWKSLEQINVTKDTPVTLKLKDATVGQALGLVMEQVSSTATDKFSRVYWVLDKGVVTVATGTALSTETRTKVIDVADLLMVVPNFESPRINLSSGSGNNAAGNSPSIFNTPTNSATDQTGDANDSNMAAKRAQARDSLIAIVKNSIGQDMWAPDGKGTITIFNGKMVISQTLLGWKLLEEIVGRP